MTIATTERQARPRDVDGRFATRVCPQCGDARNVELLRLSPSQFCAANVTYRRDYAALLGVDPDSQFPIVECVSCAFAFAKRLPDEAFLQRVYDAVIDERLGREHSLHPSWIAHQSRVAARLMARLARDATVESSRPKVLDFGCGYGTLTRILAAAYADCVGYETSPRCIEFARTRGIEVATSEDDLRGRAPFDAVVLSDVLEHVADPKGVLLLCRSLLHDNGVLSVSVPEFPRARLESIRRELALGRLVSQEVNPWEHLNYFSNATLRRMLADCGFTVLAPDATLDVGLREGSPGAARLANAVKSAWRALRYAISGRIPGTFFHARPSAHGRVPRRSARSRLKAEVA